MLLATKYSDPVYLHSKATHMLLPPLLMSIRIHMMHVHTLACHPGTSAEGGYQSGVSNRPMKRTFQISWRRGTWAFCGPSVSRPTQTHCYRSEVRRQRFNTHKVSLPWSPSNGKETHSPDISQDQGGWLHIVHTHSRTSAQYFQEITCIILTIVQTTMVKEARMSVHFWYFIST